MTFYLKLVLTAVVTVSFTGLLFAQEPHYVWHRSYGDGTSGNTESQIVTAANDLYVLIGHSGAIDTDPGIYDSMPGTGLTLVKYDHQRRYLWHRHIGTNVGALRLKADDDENIFVYGVAYSSFDGDPGPGTTTLVSGGCVLKFGPDGTFYWAKQLFSGLSSASFNGMAIDPHGNLYMAGQYGGTIDADPSPAVYTIGGTPSSGFLVKWDNDGNLATAFALNNGSGPVASFDVEAMDDKIFLSGTTYNIVDVDPSPTAFMAGVNFAASGLIIHYDTLLQLQNVVTMPTDQQTLKMSISPAGLTISGVCTHTFDADPSGPVVNNLINTSNAQQPFFLRFNTALEYQWGAYLEASTNAISSMILNVDQKDNGEFFLLGKYNRPLDVDPGTGTFLVSDITGNESNLFVAHYSNTGTFVEALALTNTVSLNGGEVTCSDNSRFFVGGGYRGVIDLNPAVSNEENVLSGTSNKPFLLELSSIAPDHYAVYDTICSGMSFQHGDSAYMQSGKYLYRFERADGSDSIVTLHLHVRQADTRVAVSGTYIFPLETNADAYTLFDCTAGTVIGTFPGDSIQPPNNGPVALIVSKNGCTDTSECVQVSLANNATNPVLTWGDRLSRTELGRGASLTTDRYNNAYVAGSFSGLANVKLFGEKLLVYETPSSGDAIVSKYTADGIQLWSYTMGITGTATITEVAECIGVDAAGNVYVGGTYEGTVDMENDELYFDNMADVTPTACCTNTAFLLKLNENGQLLWYKIFNGNGSVTAIHDIAFDSQGNVGIVGYSSSLPVDLDPGPATVYSPSRGTFFGKYTPGGALLYGHSILSDAGNQNYNTGIGFDSQDNMIVTGRSNLNADYDPSGATFMLNGAAAGSGQTFLAKYNPAFQLQWARVFGKVNHNAQPYADMEIDSDDNILLMTGLNGANTFPDGAGNPAYPVNFYGTYLVRFTPQGGFSKLYDYRGPDTGRPLGFDLDRFNNIYLSGDLTASPGSVSFGPSASLTFANGGTYVAKYQREGTLGFYFPIADETQAASYATHIQCDEAGSFYIANHGNATGGFDIDPSAGVTLLQSTSSYLVKYGTECTAFAADITLSGTVLTATPADAWYEWYFAPDSLLVQAGWADTLAPCGAGDFYCVVKQGACTAVSDTLLVPAVPQEAALLAANDPVCANPWEFDLLLDGICPDSYTWYVNGSPAGNADSLLMPLENGDSVYCIVEDIFGNELSTDTLIISFTQTAILTTSTDPDCAQIVEFGLSTDGICPDSYAWYVNGVFAQSSDSLVLPSPNDGDYVYCVVTDLYGNAIVTDTVVVDVPEPVVMLAPANDTICPGDVLNLGIDVQHICPDSFTWYVNGLPDQTSQTAVLPFPAAGDLVYCLVQDIFGGVFSSDTFEVQVYPMTTPVVALWPDSLAATAGYASYQWLDCTAGYTPVPGATDAYLLPVASGEYAVAVTTADGCADTSGCISYDDVNAVATHDPGSISVYPNPTDGKLFVRLPESESAVTITLYDAAGRRIAPPQQATGASFELTIAGATGLYLLEVSSERWNVRIPVVKN